MAYSKLRTAIIVASHNAEQLAMDVPIAVDWVDGNTYDSHVQCAAQHLRLAADIKLKERQNELSKASAEVR